MAFDGTGYGTDGTIWGGEILVAGYRDAERVGSLAPVPLPGGDAAIRRPCRVALAHLWAAGIEWADDLAPAGALPPDERAVLDPPTRTRAGCVATSSMGRLFDAVSSLVGLRHHADVRGPGGHGAAMGGRSGFGRVSPFAGTASG